MKISSGGETGFSRKFGPAKISRYEHVTIGNQVLNVWQIVGRDRRKDKWIGGNCRLITSSLTLPGFSISIPLSWLLLATQTVNWQDAFSGAQWIPGNCRLITFLPNPSRI